MCARHRLRGRGAAASAGGGGPRRAPRSLRIHGPGDPAPAVRCPARRRDGGVGHKRYPVALHGRRHRDGLRPCGPRRARHRCDRRRARKAASRTCLEEAPLRKGRLTLADNYPADLLYHPEHDWVRIEGDDATFGITWYAQDALGEVVFYDPPEIGSSVTKDQSYAEVESVKAVSDVI